MEEQEQAPERRREPTVRRGDKYVPLSERLDIIEKRQNYMGIVLFVLTVEHIAAIPQLFPDIAKFIGAIVRW